MSDIAWWRPAYRSPSISEYSLKILCLGEYSVLPRLLRKCSYVERLKVVTQVVMNLDLNEIYFAVESAVSQLRTIAALSFLLRDGIVSMDWNHFEIYMARAWHKRILHFFIGTASKFGKRYGGLLMVLSKYSSSYVQAANPSQHVRKRLPYSSRLEEDL